MSGNIPQDPTKPLQSNENRVLIDSLSQLKQQAAELFSVAKRSIQLYSHALDPRVLNDRSIEKIMLQLIKQSSLIKIQILIDDESLLRGVDHRLVALSQRFSSYITIKVIPKDYRENIFGFYLIDGRQMIYRSNIERYEAEKLTLPNLIIQEKSRLFNDIWQMASPSSLLRAIYL